LVNCYVSGLYSDSTKYEGHRLSQLRFFFIFVSFLRPGLEQYLKFGSDYFLPQTSNSSSTWCCIASLN
jgi:hypothetical protein